MKGHSKYRKETGLSFGFPSEVDTALNAISEKDHLVYLPSYASQLLLVQAWTTSSPEPAWVVTMAGTEHDALASSLAECKLPMISEKLLHQALLDNLKDDSKPIHVLFLDIQSHDHFLASRSSLYQLLSLASDHLATSDQGIKGDPGMNPSVPFQGAAPSLSFLSTHRSIFCSATTSSPAVFLAYHEFFLSLTPSDTSSFPAPLVPFPRNYCFSATLFSSSRFVFYPSSTLSLSVLASVTAKTCPSNNYNAAPSPLASLGTSGSSNKHLALSSYERALVAADIFHPALVPSIRAVSPRLTLFLKVVLRRHKRDAILIFVQRELTKDALKRLLKAGNLANNSVVTSSLLPFCPSHPSVSPSTVPSLSQFQVIVFFDFVPLTLLDISSSVAASSSSQGHSIRAVYFIVDSRQRSAFAAYKRFDRRCSALARSLSLSDRKTAWKTSAKHRTSKKGECSEEKDKEHFAEEAASNVTNSYKQEETGEDCCEAYQANDDDGNTIKAAVADETRPSEKMLFKVQSDSCRAQSGNRSVKLTETSTISYDKVNTTVEERSIKDDSSHFALESVASKAKDSHPSADRNDSCRGLGAEEYTTARDRLCDRSVEHQDLVETRVRTQNLDDILKRSILQSAEVTEDEESGGNSRLVKEVSDAPCKSSRPRTSTHPKILQSQQLSSEGGLGSYSNDGRKQKLQQNKEAECVISSLYVKRKLFHEHILLCTDEYEEVLRNITRCAENQNMELLRAGSHLLLRMQIAKKRTSFERELRRAHVTTRAPVLLDQRLVFHLMAQEKMLFNSNENGLEKMRSEVRVQCIRLLSVAQVSSLDHTPICPCYIHSASLGTGHIILSFCRTSSSSDPVIRFQRKNDSDTSDDIRLVITPDLVDGCLFVNSSWTSIYIPLKILPVVEIKTRSTSSSLYERATLHDVPEFNTSKDLRLIFAVKNACVLFVCWAVRHHLPVFVCDIGKRDSAELGGSSCSPTSPVPFDQEFEELAKERELLLKHLDSAEISARLPSRRTVLCTEKAVQYQDPLAHPHYPPATFEHSLTGVMFDEHCSYQMYHHHHSYGQSSSSPFRDFHRVRVVTVTPLGIRCTIRHEAGSNRVLRYFDRDKFLRVEFADEDGSVLRPVLPYDSRLLERIRGVLSHGIQVGSRHYVFVGASSSQLRTGGMWFMVPYFAIEPNKQLKAISDSDSEFTAEDSNGLSLSGYATDILTANYLRGCYSAGYHIRNDKEEERDSGDNKMSSSVPATMRIRAYAENRRYGVGEKTKMKHKKDAHGEIGRVADRRYGSKRQEDEGTRQLIGPDSVREWIGDLRTIGGVGKHVARLGLAFTTTTDVGDDFEILDVPDIERNGYCFTEGVGIISESAAKSVSARLALPHVPSAFQIRCGGRKGVLAVYGTELLEKILGSRFSEGGRKAAVAVFRPSMTKFRSSHRALEVVTWSRPAAVFLNRQVVAVFEGLGVSSEVFVQLHDEHVLDAVFGKSRTRLSSPMTKGTGSLSMYSETIRTDEGKGRRRGNGKKSSKIRYDDEHQEDDCAAVDGSNGINVSDAFHHSYDLGREFLYTSFSSACSAAYHITSSSSPCHSPFPDLSRARIRVQKGRTAIGVIDETNTLKPQEIFFMYRKADENECGPSHHRSIGSFVIALGLVVIYKNPVVHPGDVRVARCVDCPLLHKMRDVVVFSSQGDRPLFHMCSGSDLDGDAYSIIWEPRLLPVALFKPFHYSPSFSCSKTNVLLLDMVSFVTRNFSSAGVLGVLANSHLAAADRYGLFSRQALALAELFIQTVDAAKTGMSAVLPSSLAPSAWPDFMASSAAVPVLPSDAALAKKDRGDGRYHQNASGGEGDGSRNAESSIETSQDKLNTSCSESEDGDEAQRTTRKKVIVPIYTSGRALGLLARRKPLIQCGCAMCLRLGRELAKHKKARLEAVFGKSVPCATSGTCFLNRRIALWRIDSRNDTHEKIEAFHRRGDDLSGESVGSGSHGDASASSSSYYDLHLNTLFLSTRGAALLAAVENRCAVLGQVAAGFAREAFSTLMALGAFDDKGGIDDLLGLVLEILNDRSLSGHNNDTSLYSQILIRSASQAGDSWRSWCIFQCGLSVLIPAPAAEKAAVLVFGSRKALEHGKCVAETRAKVLAPLPTPPVSVVLRGMLGSYELVEFSKATTEHTSLFPGVGKDHGSTVCGSKRQQCILMRVELKNSGKCDLEYHTQEIREYVRAVVAGYWDLRAKRNKRSRECLQEESENVVVKLGIGTFMVTGDSRLVWESMSVRRLEDSLCKAEGRVSAVFETASNGTEEGSSQENVLGMLYFITQAKHDIRLKITVEKGLMAECGRGGVWSCGWDDESGEMNFEKIWSYALRAVKE